MIISHRHRFIFIKTQKTAGTSIELALACICGPEDVITPLVDPDDRSLRDTIGPACRRDQHHYVPWRALEPLDVARAIWRRQRPQFSNHAGAAEIRRHVPSPVWNSYYKFCVERNPWDKAVSLYFWWRRLESRYHADRPRFLRDFGTFSKAVAALIERSPVGDMTLSEFVQSGRVNRGQDFDRYAIDGDIVVDRVLQYDRLAADLGDVSARLGIELPALPRAKAGVREEGPHYRDLLSDADRQRIARVFAREIAHFGYAF